MKKLSDFTIASDDDYRWLYQKIDSLPDGVALFFDGCELPLGCRPPHATVAITSEANRYSVGLAENVSYYGNNRAMQLLATTPVSFQSFSGLRRFLLSLPIESRVLTESTHPQIDFIPEITAVPETAPPPLEYTAVQRELEKCVIGQENAVETIAHHTTLHLNKRNPKRPLSIVAYGPPGTGKSESAKALPEILSRLSRRNYSTVWTDLNSFTEAHSVNRLIGSPPGYIGYDDTPIFEAVTHNPHTVFIFDELDKAHPEVLKTFMSILDEGRCASRKEQANHSREFDFRHCLFIFTSNFRLGKQPERKGIGFSISESVENINCSGDDIEVSYRDNVSEKNNQDSITKRIYGETESARKAFIEAGVLREIASRFGCFVEFKELTDEAKRRILAKQVIETGFEYDVRLTYISSAILASLAEASGSEDALTVRSNKSVIDGYLASAFAEAGRHYGGQNIRLEGTLDNPSIVST